MIRAKYDSRDSSVEMHEWSSMLRESSEVNVMIVHRLFVKIE